MKNLGRIVLSVNKADALIIQSVLVIQYVLMIF